MRSVADGAVTAGSSDADIVSLVRQVSTGQSCVGVQGGGGGGVPVKTGNCTCTEH